MFWEAIMERLAVLHEILAGRAPSDVFRRIFAADSSMSNSRLGEMLADEFVELDSLAEQLVWRWMGPGKTQGLSDANLDGLLLSIFRDSGYSVPDWSK
ncbi:hypothetical protein GTP58_03760 [Duganella sp. CY15W]|uniref:hypothetical protein n=1 Tax=Duganella sp. CY15W TaxID=2692172 RepID=UPI00136E2E8D|nr:hypothetical protein [Duganella sp. CY15W]MYM27432.1 hypothetical protein [Duganella sp. CY15W]